MITNEPFPRGPDELDVAWLSHALGEQVLDFSSTVIGADSGMLGSLACLDLTYAAANSAKPARIVAKFSADRAGSLESARRGGTHERELRYYAELDGKTPSRTPMVYGSWYDPDTARFVLLQECIDGDKTVDQLNGLELGRATMVVRELARLHNAWWDHEASLDERSWLPRVGGAQRRMNLGTLAEAGWPALLAILGDIDPRWEAFGADLKTHVLSLLEEVSALPATLLHSDIRVDNLLFTDEEVVLVDWQGACIGPPGFELAYFISQASGGEDFESFEAELLKEYTAELARLGRTTSIVDITRGYSSSLVYGLVIACAIPIISDPNEARAPLLARSMATRAFTALEQHGRL